MTEGNPARVSFDERFSYSVADEAIARDPTTDLSYVYRQYNSAGMNDRFEANLERLSLQDDPPNQEKRNLKDDPGIRLAKRAFLTTSVMDTRADGLWAAHPLMVANRGMEDLGHTDPDEIIADLLHDTVEDHPEKLSQLLGYKHGTLKNYFISGIKKLPENRFSDLYLQRQERALALQAIAGTWSQQCADHIEGVSNPIPLIDTPNNNDKAYIKHIRKIATARLGIKKVPEHMAEYSSLTHAGITKVARRAGIVTSDVLRRRQATKTADVLNNAGENDRTSNPVLQLRTDIKHVRTIPMFLQNLKNYVPEEKRESVAHLLQQAEAGCQTRIDKYLVEHPDGPSLKEIRRRGKAALRGVPLRRPDIGMDHVDIPELINLYESVQHAAKAMDDRLENAMSLDKAA